MNFHIAAAARTTGEMLRTLVEQKLAEEHHTRPNPSHICYGVGYNGQGPTLNGACSTLNKLEQAEALREGLGPGALDVWRPGRVWRPRDFPSMARTLVHSRGRDIKMVLEPWQVDVCTDGGSAFFTKYEPSVREFRTWVYRKRHLGTYEKILRRPADYKRLGRNHDNGFDFSGLENAEVPETLKTLSRNAIRILNLDFGAVDVLQHPDGHLIVLEVNSAPGVSGEHRRVIQGLAHRVVRWIINDYPRREA